MTRTGIAVLLAFTAACSTPSEPVTMPSSTVVATTVATPATTPATPGTEPSTTTAPDPSTWADQVDLGESWGTFDSPVHIEHHPANELVYVVERAGVVQRVTAEGTVLTPPALDLGDEVRSGGEQGLLGLAFNSAGDQAFVNFTNRDGDTVIAAVGLNGDGTFNTSFWRELLRLEQPYGNHNGGEVLMGPDGGLWVPTGDGGSADDPDRVALDPTSRLGKLLRIDPDTGDVVIWAAGLRNPWRASFDTVTGDLWIADVGQGAWEEISVAWERQQWARGLNFGWSAFEGTHRFNDDQPTQDHVAPVFEYPHGALGCSITGGVRYRGVALGDLRGAYVFSDYCSGRISALPVDDTGTVGQPVVVAQGDQVVAIRADRQGELWVVSLNGDVRPLISAGLP